jgi:putative copper resistance protein D
MSYWIWASSASKMLGLLAMAGVTGGSFSLGLAARLQMAQGGKILRYVCASAVLGLFAACLFFLVQIGALNQAGIAGMFDRTMIGIIGQSSLGYAAAVRALCFACIAVAALWMHGRARTFVFAAAIVALSFSFSLTGHISTLSYAARLGIVLHVLAAFLWVGSLYPLLRLSVVEGLADVKRLMVLFGNLAVVIVGVLLLSGVLLLTQSIGSFEELFTTAYGRAFLVKLSGVVALLWLAAANKLLLVPELTTTNSARRLRLSIRMEILVACFVLAVTAWLTTVIGPAR